MRHSGSVLGKIVGAGGMCLLPLALLANVAMAQKAIEKAIEPLSLACNTTVTSGSGNGYMGVCISAHGNVLNFEGPKGLDHMYADGYALAVSGDLTETCYYDIGDAEARWAPPNPPVRPGATLPLTITRSTTDGKFRLVQKFTRNPTERELTIQMTLTNTSGQTQYLRHLGRFMDFDVNNSRYNDLIDNTRRSVAVREDTQSGDDQGAIATAISPTNAFVFAWKHPLPDPEFRCFRAGNSVDTPYVSSGTDDVYGILYFTLGTSPGSDPVPMANGTSKVFTMQYQLY